jgi:hypothetical protein
LTHGRDIKPLSVGDECHLPSTELHFHRTAFYLVVMLGRIEAAQQRFHGWRKKGKISIGCFSGHVELLKFVSDHCCNSVAHILSRFPRPIFQKILTGGNLPARPSVLVEAFAGKHEK